MINEFASTAAAAIALRWFYREAAGDCGLRSPFGGQLEMVSARLPGVTYHDSRKVVLSDDAITQRLLESAERANEIGRHLKRVSRASQHVLELQYGSDFPMGDSGITVALACSVSGSKVVTLARLHTRRTKDQEAADRCEEIRREAQDVLDSAHREIVR